jgi:hypothetical protein
MPTSSTLKKKKKSAWKNKLVSSKILALKRVSKTLSNINKFSHENYMKRFIVAAEKHNFSCVELGSNRKVFYLGSGAMHLAIISGIHGEERAGPIALLKFLERTKVGSLIPNNISLLISPLLGFDAWDKKSRENEKLNLNESWSKKAAPDYIHKLKIELENFKPDLFFDFHEDSTIEDEEPYLFRRKSNKNIIFELQNAMDICRKKGIWRKSVEYPGSSESFAHSIGCPETTTVETPQTQPLRNRVGFNLAVLDWIMKKFETQEIRYKSLHTFWYSEPNLKSKDTQINITKTRYNTRKTTEEQAINRIENIMKKKGIEDYSIFEY